MRQQLPDVAATTVPAGPSRPGFDEVTARRAAQRYRLRWRFFVLAVVGLVTTGAGLSLHELHGWVWEVVESVTGLPAYLLSKGLLQAGAYGALAAMVGTVGFVGYGLAGRLEQRRLGPSPAHPTDDLAPLTLSPGLPEARLRRRGLRAVEAFAATGLILPVLCLALEGGWSSGMSGLLDLVRAVLANAHQGPWSIDHVSHSLYAVLAASTPALMLGAALRPRVGGRTRSLLGGVPAAPAALPEPDDAGRPLALGPVEVPSTPAACPVCGWPVESTPRRCEQCGTPHHPDCFDYAGGCAIYGCRSAAAPASVAGHGGTQLASVVTRWTVLQRLQLNGMCVAALGVAMLSWSTLLPTELLGSRVVALPVTLMGLLYRGGFLLTAAGFLAYVALGVPLHLARRRMEALTDRPPDAGSASREVLERLEGPAAGSLLHGALVGISMVSLVLLCLLPFVWAAYEPGQLLGMALRNVAVALAVAGALPLALLVAARRGLAFAASLQNRLSAELERSKRAE